MSDLNIQQEKEIGAMQSDIRHISLAVERIEKMMVEHNKTHAVMNAKVDNRLSAIEFWVTAVKWGAGVLTAAIVMFAPALNKIVQNRPTEEKVIAIIQREITATDIKTKEKE